MVRPKRNNHTTSTFLGQSKPLSLWPLQNWDVVLWDLLQFPISYCILQPQLLRVNEARLADATPVLHLRLFLSTMSNAIPMSAATLLVPMASAAPLFMANNSASHDDNATGLCVELRLTIPVLVDTTPSDVLFLLDLHLAQSESVHAVRVVSNASNLNYCWTLRFSGSCKYFRPSYDFALILLLRWC